MTDNPLVQPIVPRNDLAQVFKDPRTLKAFEAFQRQVAQVLPDNIQAAYDEANAANATATTALAEADAANATANTANATANAALIEAAIANTTANSALAEALVANGVATTANGTANTANGTANSANGTANTANSTANTALAEGNALKAVEYVLGATDATVANARVLTGDTGLTVDLTTPHILKLLLNVVTALGYTPAATTSGTFTPELAFGGGSTGITYALQQGRWTKNGRLVTLEFDIILTSKGSSTGPATIAGSPFAPVFYSPAVAIWDALSAAATPSAFMQAAVSTVFLYISDGSTLTSTLNDTNFTNGSATYMQITFSV